MKASSEKELRKTFNEMIFALSEQISKDSLKPSVNTIKKIEKIVLDFRKLHEQTLFNYESKYQDMIEGFSELIDRTKVINELDSLRTALVEQSENHIKNIAEKLDTLISYQEEKTSGLMKSTVSEQKRLRKDLFSNHEELVERVSGRLDSLNNDLTESVGQFLSVAREQTESFLKKHDSMVESTTSLQQASRDFSDLMSRQNNFMKEVVNYYEKSAARFSETAEAQTGKVEQQISGLRKTSDSLSEQMNKIIAEQEKVLSLNLASMTNVLNSLGEEIQSHKTMVTKNNQGLVKVYQKMTETLNEHKAIIQESVASFNTMKNQVISMNNTQTDFFSKIQHTVESHLAASTEVTARIIKRNESQLQRLMESQGDIRRELDRLTAMTEEGQKGFWEKMKGKK